jgi:hypothetical protein
LQLTVTHFTDPACPFAFSAEPGRMRLRWYYGDQLRWRIRMIVLTLEPGEAERLAEGAPNLQRIHGMPAYRAVVAVHMNAPASEEPLLRRLRVMRHLDPRDARAALSPVATPTAAGADFYWSLA